MRYRLAANVASTSLIEAARLAVPIWRALSPRRIRRLAGADSHQARDEMLRAWSLQLLDALAVEIHADGLDNVGSGPFLVAALHEGFMDVPLLLAQLGLPLSFVARKELADERPIGSLLRSSRQIMIEPEAPGAMRALLRETALLIAQGRSVAVFPQGSLLGVETAFQAGAWIAASKLDIPMLPVAVWGTHKVWDYPFSPVVSSGKPVRLVVLPPRRIESEEQFRALEAEMKDIALGDTAIAPRRYVPATDGYWDGYRFEIDPRFRKVAAEITDHRRRTQNLQRR